jgi:uncharacterized membrane protein
MEAIDLRTQQFSAVFSAVESSEEHPVAVKTKMFCRQVFSNEFLVAVMTGLCTAFILVIIKPPFIVRFNIDKHKPWQARSNISWMAIAVISAMVGICALVIPGAMATFM